MHDDMVQPGNSKDQDRVDPLPVSRDRSKRPVPEKYEFGPFCLEPVERKLLRGSEVVALTPKAFDTLHVLVRNSGHLVEKEELMRLLWPDTFVEEGSLTNNIFLLRKALGEDVAYIETVPTRGYRFVGAVRQMPHVVERETSPHESPPRHAGAPQTASPATRQSGFRIPALIGMFVVGITLVILLLWNRHRAQSADIGGPNLPPKVVPLISLPGEERMPAFSPDGSRIAFVWSAPDTNKSGIYAVVVGSQSLLRLTNNANDYSPVWSPDGRFVAFLRESSGKVLVEEIAAFGGAERVIHSGMTSLLSQGYKQGSGLSFSPDGKLAFTELNPATQIDSIRVLSAEDSGSRFVTSPPVNFVDRFPVFSPDGRGLAFVRSSGPIYVDELFFVSLVTGNTLQLTFDHHRIFGPPTFTRDGRAVVFSSNRAGLESLWRIPISGGSPKEVPSAGPATLYPSVSQTGRYMAYERNEDEENIWQLALQDETHASSRARVLIPAGNTDNFLPQFSPDGTKIAFQSNRSGYSEIWVCDEDGSDLVQITNVQSLTGSPRWSPDSRYIAFDTRRGEHSEIDVVEIPGDQIHRLIGFPDADSVVPSWSRDGRWLYFASNRGGKLMHIWKVAVHNGEADTTSVTQVTRAVGYAAFEAPDGRLLFYANPPFPGIWTASQDDRHETTLWNGPGPDQWSNWAVNDDGIYFLAPAQPGPTIDFLNFRTGQVSKIGQLERQAFYGFALAPNGKSLIFSQQDHNEREIVIMSEFQ